MSLVHIERLCKSEMSHGVHTRVPGRVSWVAYVSVSKCKDIDYEVRMG